MFESSNKSNKMNVSSVKKHQFQLKFQVQEKQDIIVIDVDVLVVIYALKYRDSCQNRIKQSIEYVMIATLNT